MISVFTDLGEEDRNLRQPENRYDLVRERTQAGLTSARKRGSKLGRPPPLSVEQIEMARTLMSNPKLSARQVAEQLGVHRSTLYRYLSPAT